jgi:alpha-D-ribose 1-methylphosphonate 5-triphosphate diphosphatase
MRGEIFIKNATIVLPNEVFRGTLRVNDGIILDLDRTRNSPLYGMDFEGDYLLPGLIELHTDHLENHLAPRPGISWPSMAAILSHDAEVAISGITTVFDALAIGDLNENHPRVRNLEEMVKGIGIAQNQHLLRADHFLHLRCELGYPRLLEVFENLVQAPQVKLVSLMDHTPGQRQFTDMKKFCQYYQGKYGFNDEQMRRLIVERQEKQKRYAPKHQKEILKISKERGLPVASHDDTTFEHVAEAASEGILLCEFPTTLDAARAARAFGLKIMMGAPNLILGGSHSGNAAAIDLGRLKLLDILSSDYVPSSLLQGAFSLHQELGIPLPEAIATVTLRPAQIVNLHDRGALEVGKRADFIRVKWNGQLPLVRNVWKAGVPIV